MSALALFSKRSDVADGGGWLLLPSLSDSVCSFFGFFVRGFGGGSLRICRGETGAPDSSAAVFWARLLLVSNGCNGGECDCNLRALDGRSRCRSGRTFRHLQVVAHPIGVGCSSTIECFGEYCLFTCMYEVCMLTTELGV